MPWGLAARCRPAPTGQGTGARQRTWGTAPRARGHEAPALLPRPRPRAPTVASLRQARSSSGAPGAAQLLRAGARAGGRAQRVPGSGAADSRGAPPSETGRAGAARGSRALCTSSSSRLFSENEVLVAANVRKPADPPTPARSPPAAGPPPPPGGPGRRPSGPEGERPARPVPTSRSGTRRSQAAASHSGFRRWDPAFRISGSRTAPRARPPRTKRPLQAAPDRRRGPAPWPLRPAPAWPCPRRFSGCVLLLQAPPAGGRGTGSGRDALGTEPHRLVSPAASCCPGLRCD